MNEKQINLDFSIKLENEAKVSVTVRVPQSVKQTLNKARKLGISTTEILIKAVKSLEKQLPKD